jgi:primase-polymerase (primpol)-like protein
MMRGNLERPVPFQCNLRNLPEALDPLKKIPNWVCWRFEWKVDRKGIGSWTKPPFQPDNPGRHAKNNDSSTWGTFEQALAAFESSQSDCIGFNLSGTDIAAFDIDKCRDRATGEIAPEAMKIVNRATSYTEITPSGTGLRVVGYGFGAKVHRKQKIPRSSVEVESYRGAERYITITGNPLPGTLDAWPHMVDIGDVIVAVVAELDGCKDEARQDKASQDNAQQDLDDEFAASADAEPASA